VIKEKRENTEDQGVIVKNIDTEENPEDHQVHQAHLLTQLLRRRIITKKEEKSEKALDLILLYV
jgi:hypothetical protein